MSRYKVDKDRVAARLYLANGETINGYFFVLASLPNAAGGERVGDLLNAEDGFFPFQREEHTTAQYNRAHVALVQLEAGRNEEALEPGYDVALRRPVVMMLSTGLRVEGIVTVYGPVGHERLSDYTRRAKHFRYVATAEGTLIVNSDHIVEVIEKADQ
jgi:hypothetical protein